MSQSDLSKEIFKELNLLPLELQFQVKDYVHQLASKTQKPKNDFSSVFGIISKEEAQELEKIIEEGCEQIDPNGW